jgi:hypothetical protein
MIFRVPTWIIFDHGRTEPEISWLKKSETGASTDVFYNDIQSKIKQT